MKCNNVIVCYIKQIEVCRLIHLVSSEKCPNSFLFVFYNLFYFYDASIYSKGRKKKKKHELFSTNDFKILFWI